MQRLKLCIGKYIVNQAGLEQCILLKVVLTSSIVEARFRLEGFGHFNSENATQNDI